MCSWTYELINKSENYKYDQIIRNPIGFPLVFCCNPIWISEIFSIYSRSVPVSTPVHFRFISGLPLVGTGGGRWVFGRGNWSVVWFAPNIPFMTVLVVAWRSDSGLAMGDGYVLPGWSIPPPPFRRCSFGARPLRTERGAEEMRGKVEASIDQPLRERQATKGTAWTDIKGI